MITRSAEETRMLGARLARKLRAGDTVLLEGGLGAGKSELARGVARGLGITGPVPSPSFTILNAYDEGRLPLYHFDWYRIADGSDIGDMGLNEMIGGDGVALIEWGERGEEWLPERALKIVIRPLDGDDREITFQPLGGFPFKEDEWL